MPFDPKIHHRHSIRLQGYDYRLPGGYFITLVASRHACIFGAITNGRFNPNPVGRIVEEQWQRIPRWFQVRLDAWVLMPNHFHAILLITDANHLPPEDTPGSSVFHDPVNELSIIRPSRTWGAIPGSLNAVLQTFKSVTTRKINQMKGTPRNRIWQRNYYEHIIRDIDEWSSIREYIETNPINWETDHEFGRP